MDAHQIIARYRVSPETSALLLDTVNALREAEMHETLLLLRVRVFGSARVLDIDPWAPGTFRLRPFAELLLIELAAIADAVGWTPALRTRKARDAFRGAGFL